MKDIEKIKSEDLGCQVQDANPGNFAIEQEVGAMVGATVPAPTEPSADDARELGAQLLVFLRRALLPIRSALRTALADIYAHLDSRCTDYTPAAYAPYQPLPSYDPMGTLPARSVANLLTAITAFADRKISGVPEAVDGMSLANLLGSAARNDITEITDPTKGWTLIRNNLVSTLVNLFPGLDNVTIGCGKATVPIANGVSGLKHLSLPDITESAELAFNCANVEDIYIPKLKKCQLTLTGRHDNYFIGGNKCTDIDAPELESVIGQQNLWGHWIFKDLPNCKKISAPKLATWTNQWFYNNNAVNNCAVLEEVDFRSVRFNLGASFADCPKLIKLILTLDYSQSLAAWNPTLTDDNRTTFLHNFLEHICQRLANRTGQTKLTLTLSADVYTAIMTDNDIKAELVARNWKVTDGTNNYNN